MSAEMWANALSLRRLVFYGLTGIIFYQIEGNLKLFFFCFLHLIELRWQVSSEVENHIDILQKKTKNREQREEEREK